MDIGTVVRIVVDEYPQLVGVVGTIEKISDDETTAWVTTNNKVKTVGFFPFGVWCSISNLEEV